MTLWEGSIPTHAAYAGEADMRRTIGILLISVVCFVVGRLSSHVPVSAQGQPGYDGHGAAAVPSGNGDVNADGRLDIADAIYIISNQFHGGPAPLPIACPPTGLPATGQTKCYGYYGDTISCDSADFPGQDGFYKAGCPGEGRFMDNGDGTVTDTCTGLMWQKDTPDMNGSGVIGDGDCLTVQEALGYCEDLDFAGHDDWRLPNVRELQSIVDHERNDPAIDPIFKAEPKWYWSSTSYARRHDMAWFVDFSYGYSSVAGGGKGLHYYVRAVRTAP
jgi:hypothetical protein